MQFGRCSGISFIDSTPVKICDNWRISQHYVFQLVMGRNKTSIGWSYGFIKIVINNIGKLLEVKLSSGNTNDRTPVRRFTKDVCGKLFRNKGYISHGLFYDLLAEGLRVVSSIRKNVENKLMLVLDKLFLRRQMLIETMIDQLKNICQLEHSRHRSISNYFVNIAAALISYTYQEKKLSLNLHNSHQITDLLIHAF